MTLLARASAAAVALLCASVALADIRAPFPEQPTSTRYTARRGSSNLSNPQPTSLAECHERVKAAIAAEGATRTSGNIVYQCITTETYAVYFVPPPPPTCGERPGPDEQEPRTCPTGTVGTWLQDRVWTLHPAPTCWVQGDWTPTEPPAGMCAPADSDGDGVPDQADECPTVHAPTPDGCPATPPAQLTAPTNVRAAGISTSAIRVTWDAVAGASAYSLERCIGATCTGFSQLLCATGPSGTHTSLPANLTARYRVRASRDATCTSDAGRDPASTEPLNLGQYSAIVSGTTLSATPVNCAVSSWSTWTAGPWSTCSGGQQSRTETRTRTVITQPANGGTACPALTETRTVTQACGGSGGTFPVTLSWTPPTRNTNGSSLTNLAGFRIHYGTSPDALTQTIQVANPGLSSYTISDLSPGTYFFGVRAYNSGGAESELSNVVGRIVQ